MFTDLFSPEKEEEVKSYADILFPESEYQPREAATIYEKIVSQVTAAICAESDFIYAKKSALDTLSNVLVSYILQICETTKNHCEIAGRTIPTIDDVYLALISIGCDVDDFLDWCCGTHTASYWTVPVNRDMRKEQEPLHIGRKRPHPAHVAEFLPPFPDPHTYIKTEISGEPITSYRSVRERLAQRKRDTETLLVDYMLRIHPRTCLFSEYEERAKRDAGRVMKEMAQQKEALRKFRKSEKQKAKNDAMKVDPFSFPDCLMEEDDPHNKSISSEDEVDYEIGETETSLVLKRIPAYCSILDPSQESRPYLSALVCEETQDDEKTEKSAKKNQTNAVNDDQSYDNAFLRPPRMPANGNYARL